VTLYRCIHWLLRQVVRHGLGLSVNEAHHLPAQGPAILAVNHVSALDPVLVGVAVDRPLWFMAKEELFRHRLLGPLIRRLHAFPVRRDRADIATVRRTLELLRRGEAVMMFPEGTRHDGVTLGAVRPGVAILAARANVPVVPAYHDGAGRILPRGARWPRRHPVRVFFGPPMRPSPAVTADPAAAEAFGQQLREQWALLRFRAEGGAHPSDTARADGPDSTPREEVRPA
jgi:1-acyl-sn-glycerol-3-phosphate acyltransferase